jgi:hypothetical protein
MIAKPAIILSAITNQTITPDKGMLSEAKYAAVAAGPCISNMLIPPAKNNKPISIRPNFVPLSRIKSRCGADNINIIFYTIE